MNDVTSATSDWRDSLNALGSLNGFNFVYSQQIPRVRAWPKLLEGSAEKALRDSASAGNVVAMEQLGACLLWIGPGTKLAEEGAEWLRRSAGANNPVAMLCLAEHLLASEVPAMVREAEALLERAIETRFLPAQVALAAHILEASRSPDAPRAIELLRNAAHSGSRIAHVVLAACLISGCGVPVDRDAGVGWLRRLGATTPALMGGLAGFLYSRALVLRGRERRRQSWLAATLFGEAIRRGNLEDEVNLAYLIRRSEVPGRDFPSLDALLSRHVADGSAHALMNQALRLAMGVSCAVDWRAADALVARVDDPESLVSWWQPLASGDDAEGHLVLGWLARHRLWVDPEALTLAGRLGARRASELQVPDWLHIQTEDS